MCFEHRREKRARGRTRFISQSFGLFYTRESRIWSFSESGKYRFKFLGVGHFLKSRPLFFYINAGFCDETLKFISRLEGRTGGTVLSPLSPIHLSSFSLLLSPCLPLQCSPPQTTPTPASLGAYFVFSLLQFSPRFSKICQYYHFTTNCNKKVKENEFQNSFECFKCCKMLQIKRVLATGQALLW